MGTNRFTFLYPKEIDMKYLFALVVSTISIAFGTLVQACDMTLSPGENIQSALDITGVSDVCLNTGIYNVTSTINVPAGKRLIGVSTNQDDTQLVSSAQYVVTPQSGSTVARLWIQGTTGSLPDFGVLVGSGVSGVVVWGNRITHTTIGLGANVASNVQFLANLISGTGANNGLADPSIWINSSSTVLVQYVEIYGDSSRGGGDGEIASYNSSGVVLDANYINWSGAAGVYMVNCNSCSVTNSFIRYAGEYGIDVVGGSANFVAANNEVSNSHFGAVVYEVLNNSTATVNNNNFWWNGTPGCDGVHVEGSPSSNISMSGNYTLSNQARGGLTGQHDIMC
jgi:hypothetical protein